MVGHIDMVVCLPGAAAAELNALAQQHNSTITTYIGALVDEWLQRRNEGIRLGGKSAEREFKLSVTYDRR